MRLVFKVSEYETNVNLCLKFQDLKIKIKLKVSVLNASLNIWDLRLKSQNTRFTWNSRSKHESDIRFQRIKRESHKTHVDYQNFKEVIET